MGIKIYGSALTASAPLAANLGERELAFNTADGKLWTNIGGTIIEVATDRGVSFKTTTTYIAGDIVSSAGSLWIAVAPILASVPGTVATEWSKFSNTTNTFYDASIAYDEGDIVIVGDELYVAPAGGTTAGAWDPTQWTAVSSKDIGGRAYDSVASSSGAIVYQMGDMVTEGGVAYFKTNATTEAIPGTFDITEWTRVGVEIGGIAYSITESYLIGDIVTEGNIAYRCTTATGPIAFAPASWQNIDNDVSSTVADEATLLALTPVKQGDVVQVVSTGATYKAIGSTTAVTILADWLLLGAPEKGGVIWSVTTIYKVGDVVSENGNAYVCKADHTSVTGDAVLGSPTQSTATSWDPVGVDEKGGVAYSTTPETPYVLGDVVTRGDVTYRLATATESTPGTFVPADWEDIEEEFSGAVYDSGHQYEIGDVVSIGDELYIIGEDPSNAGNPMPIGGDPTLPADNTTPNPFTTTDEVGGKIFNATTAVYSVGDVVTYNIGTLGDKLYRCILVPTTNPGGFIATDWELAEVAEVAGRLFSTTENYLAGDIVTHNDGSSTRVYVARTAVTASGWTAAEWELADIGGVEYRTDITYNEGDLVSDITATPVKVYISLQSSNIGNPLTTTPAYWQELDSEFYTATGVNSGDVDGDGAVDNPNQHCPTSALGEYPNTNAGDIVGATWYISGLGYDGSGDPIPYTMTTGSLFGAVVREGDAIYWMSGAAGTAHAGTENWRLSQRPMVSGERGGLLWRSGSTYAIGDTATEGGTTYVATTVSPAGTPSSSTGWEEQYTDIERGGILWAIGISYVIGDMVTENNILYIATGDHTSVTGDVALGSPAQPSQTNWTLAQSKPEVGGLGYDGTTASYDLGTVVGFDASGPTGVTAGEILYVANQNGALPTNVLHWTLLETSPEVGGKEYNSSVTYEAGDIVHYLGDIYVVGGTPPAVGTLPTNPLFSDIDPIGPERGGIAWAAGVAYVQGDQIWEFSVNSDQSAIWVCAASHTSVTTAGVNSSPENGGTNWTDSILKDPGTF